MIYTKHQNHVKLWHPGNKLASGCSKLIDRAHQSSDKLAATAPISMSPLSNQASSLPSGADGRVYAETLSKLVFAPAAGLSSSLALPCWKQLEITQSSTNLSSTLFWLEVVIKARSSNRSLSYIGKKEQSASSGESEQNPKQLPYKSTIIAVKCNDCGRK